MTNQQQPGQQPAVDVRQLVSDYHGLVYAIAYRLTGNPQDAEDVTQQTFLQAQQCIHQLRQPDNPGPWLGAIARSAWLKSRRRRRPVLAGTLEIDLADVPENLPDREDIDAEQLQSALDELPDEFRLVVVMFYFQQHSYKEIAKELEIPIGTVMSRLARAKTQLRRRLTDSDKPQDNRASDSAIDRNGNGSATKTEVPTPTSSSAKI